MRAFCAFFVLESLATSQVTRDDSNKSSDLEFAVSLELRGIQLPTVLLHKKPSLRVRFWNFKQFTIFCGLVKNSCFGVEIVD